MKCSTISNQYSVSYFTEIAIRYAYRFGGIRLHTVDSRTTMRGGTPTIGIRFAIGVNDLTVTMSGPEEPVNIVRLLVKREEC